MCQIGRFVAICISLMAVSVRGGEITLKNDRVLHGKIAPMQTLVTGSGRTPPGPVPLHPIVMVADDLRRYFVPEKQVVNVNPDSDLSRYQTFGLFQQRGGRSKSVVSLGGIREDSPFDDHGRRTVSINTPDGVLKVIQGVEKLHPHALKVVGLTHTWEMGLDPRSQPPETLDAMLRTATKRDNPDHRLAIFKFYLQMEVYDRADRELVTIQADFPEMADQVAGYRRVLRQVQAQQLFNELKLRQAAGQHGLAYSLSKKFPTEDVNAALLQQARGMTTEYDQVRERADRAKLLLGELQAQLTKADQIAAVAPIRTEMIEKLSIFSLERLKPFFEQVQDPQRPVDEKLALALSGWVLGPAYAVDDLDLSIRLWKARGLVLEFLREPLASRRQTILSQLGEVEGVGPERIARLLPLLPPIRETDEAPAGPMRIIQVPPDSGRESTVKLIAAKGKDLNAGENGSARYGVLLPFEYHPDHVYPLIVVLRGAGRTLQQELEWWGGTPDRPGQSQRHGYIVIAPDYVSAEQRTYEYPVEAHRIVIDALHDACLRFRVDTNRVFIAGHDMGGDAAFDLGFSHPDRFAGVIAIGGTIERFSQYYYRQNGKSLPLYVVGGELDPATREKNAADLTWMMEHNFDLIYAEYVGHGKDNFFPEIHHLFDWMRRYTRTLHPDKIEFDAMRTSENRIHWLTFDGLPSGVLGGDTNPNKAKRPMKISAQVQKGSNTVVVSCRAKNVSIWLTPDLVDFEKRLTVRLNTNTEWNKPLSPDVPRMLEDLRTRGDRQQLYWAVLDF